MPNAKKEWNKPCINILSLDYDGAHHARLTSELPKTRALTISNKYVCIMYIQILYIHNILLRVELFC